MGYTTEFRGRFKLDQELTEGQFNELMEFAESRHGDQNEFKYAPSFYCQWVPTEDRKGLKWDGNEKFYAYIKWLEVLIERFFKPWNIKLSGTVLWRGEEFDDFGEITIYGGLSSEYGYHMTVKSEGDNR